MNKSGRNTKDRKKNINNTSLEHEHEHENREKNALKLFIHQKHKIILS
jgi:hypothetical protein